MLSSGRLSGESTWPVPWDNRRPPRTYVVCVLAACALLPNMHDAEENTRRSSGGRPLCPTWGSANAPTSPRNTITAVEDNCRDTEQARTVTPGPQTHRNANRQMDLRCVYTILFRGSQPSKWSPGHCLNRACVGKSLPTHGAVARKSILATTTVDVLPTPHLARNAVPSAPKRPCVRCKTCPWCGLAFREPVLAAAQGQLSGNCTPRSALSGAPSRRGHLRRRSHGRRGPAARHPPWRHHQPPRHC